jgi:hypothetical protein
VALLVCLNLISAFLSVLMIAMLKAYYACTVQTVARAHAHDKSRLKPCNSIAARQWHGDAVKKGKMKKRQEKRHLSVQTLVASRPVFRTLQSMHGRVATTFLLLPPCTDHAPLDMAPGSHCESLHHLRLYHVIRHLVRTDGGTTTDGWFHRGVCTTC